MTSPSVLYLLIAQREGYFKAEGLNVEIINMRGEIAATGRGGDFTIVDDDDSTGLVRRSDADPS